ncbi:MAG: hypothetical protein K2O04_07035, partial [Clostridiales bacterium]|nr:hypothetical protein [Clostridiales bacterium]
MKKKFLIVFMLVVGVLSGILCLTACTSKIDTQDPTHTHNYQWVDNGNGTHKQHCSVSGCAEPDINSGSHNYDTSGVCICGKTESIVEAHIHTFTNYIYNNDATCVDDGTETAKCKLCDKTDTR